MDKDIELQKIQILESYFQTKFDAMYSLVIGGFIGFVIFFTTLYYQGIFNLFNDKLSGTVIFGILLAILFWVFGRYGFDAIDKVHNQFLEMMGLMLEVVEKGGTLPSIQEMKKQVRKKPESK